MDGSLGEHSAEAWVLAGGLVHFVKVITTLSSSPVNLFGPL
jgi:hypothetical protein